MGSRLFLHSEVLLEIKASFCIYLCMILLLLPLRWVIAILSAAAIHEACHILMLLVFRCKLRSIVLSASGMIISTSSLPPLEQIICAAAGPVGGLLAGALLYMFPRFAFCAFIQSVYNLLPLYPLDGGRILQGICGMLPDKIGRVLALAVRAATLLALCFVILWLTIHLNVINWPLEI